METLFNRKLVPFVICTETLAAGINLPARSVVLSTLLKGKHGDKKLIPSSVAHQIFGRAGRPQFDKQGYVYVAAHEDDARIVKWKKKYDQIDPNSKDPGIMRARKDLERKRPTRRKTEQYWSQGQFKQLIEAGPAKLFSRSMIPYSVLIYLLTKFGTLDAVRGFLAKRFNTPERIHGFHDRLSYMLANLEVLGYVAHVELVAPDANTPPALPDARGRVDEGARGQPGPALSLSAADESREEDPLAAVTQKWRLAHHITLNERIHKLLNFRSLDPLYGAFLVEMLNYSNYEEKLLTLESCARVPPAILRSVRVPETVAPGPLQTQVLEPQLVQLGILIAHGPVAGDASESSEGVEREGEGESGRAGENELETNALQEPRASARAVSPTRMNAAVRYTLAQPDVFDEYGDELEPLPPTLPDLLRLSFGAQLAAPEEIYVQPKWIAGGVMEAGGDFTSSCALRELIKQEGIVLRHLLRLVILAGEFQTLSGDPEYARISEAATAACQHVEPHYTKRFLQQAEAERKAAGV